MKNILYLIFIFNWFAFYAQQIVVVNNHTKEPLAFAYVIIDNKEFYTNENGVITLPKTSKTIKIHYLGYEDFSANRSELKDSVFLTPKEIVIDEVVISGKKDIQKIGYLNKSKYVTSLPLSPKAEDIIVVEPTNPEIIDSFIESVEFPLEKFKLYNKKDKLYKNAPAVVRINIYTLEDNIPNEKIFSSVPIKFIMSEKEVIYVDMSHEMIQLPKNGLAFGIEMIGRVDDNGDFVEENAIAKPTLTHLSSKDYKATTYNTNSILKEKREYYPINNINEHLMRDLKNYTAQDYNLAIGLTLSK